MIDVHISGHSFKVKVERKRAEMEAKIYIIISEIVTPPTQPMQWLHFLDKSQHLMGNYAHCMYSVVHWIHVYLGHPFDQNI